MRRGSLQIVFDILSSAKKGANKTNIMFGARMSHDQFKVYLRLLIKQSLIEKYRIKDRMIYRTTEKGVCFMKKFREIKTLLKIAR